VQKKKYRSFEDAKNFVRKLEIKNQRGWAAYCKSGKKPNNIPYHPERHYKNKGWKNYGDWLGTGMIRPRDRVYWTYDKSRDYVQKLGLKSNQAWRTFSKSGKLPKEIPANPHKVYKNKGWISFGHWFGTGSVATYLREYWSYEKARDYVHNLKLKSQREWIRYTNSGKLPKEIPADPHKVYKNKGWKGFGDWLGTGSIRPGDIEYLEFNEARKIVRELAKKYNLKTVSDYTRAKQDGLIPTNIPAAPWYVYSKKRIRKEK